MPTPTQTDRLYGLTTSVAVKPPCRVKTTGPITLRTLQTIDGVAVASGNRVLVGSQGDPAENGIYIADTSDWNRATDFDGSLDVVNGTILIVNEGSITSKGFWRADTIDPAVIPHAITFSRFVMQVASDIIINPIPGLPGATTVQQALEALAARLPVVGSIMMYAGTIASIPAGWALCDGSNGTPDLRDKFVLGGHSGRLPGDTGGSFSTDSQGAHDHGGATGGHVLTIAEMPAHTHSYENYQHSGGQAADGASANSAQTGTTGSTGGGGAHSHPITASGAHTHSNVPPYYALLFIMRVT